MAISYTQCPKCGSRKTMNIVYGEPAPVYTLEPMQKSKEREIKFGGCVVSDDSPKYACSKCGYEWNKKEAIDAAYDKINQLKISTGGFFQGHLNVEINFLTLEVSSSQGLGGEDNVVIKAMDSTTALAFVEELKRLKLLNWKASYVDPTILDGNQWNIEMVRKGRNLYKYGSNDYPAQWKEFCELISELTGEDFS